MSADKPVTEWMARRGRSHRQPRRFLRAQFRPQQNGKPKSLARGRHPFAPEPAAAFRLRFGKNHRAFLHAVAREFFNDVVGGSRFFKHADVAADNFGLAEARKQIIRQQRVRLAHQPVAKMRTGLDVETDLAQLLDARPDRRPADGQFLGKLRAGNAVGVGAQGEKDFGVSGHECSTTDKHRCTRIKNGKAGRAAT